MIDRTDLITRIRKQHASVVGDDEVCVAGLLLKSPNVDRDQRLVSGNVSKAMSDLDSEVVIPAGLDRWYFPKSVKSVYWAHQYDMMPVGACRRMGLRDNGKTLYAQTYVMKGAFGDDVLEAMDSGVVEGFSIGMKIRPDDDYGEPTKEETKEYGRSVERMIRTAMLIEYSITPMPACPGALMDSKVAALDEMVVKGRIHRSSAVIMGLPDTPERKFHAIPKARRVVVAGGAVYVR